MNIELPHNWRPRIYQAPLWSYMQGDEEGKRAACVWHRRAGKDLTALNICTYKSFQRVGTYWHILPTYQQGRKIVWFGATREGRRFLDFIPKPLIRSKNNTEMRIELKNNSIYQVVGTDNIDALVGTNPVGCVFSEYSLQNPAAWNYIRPILAENGGWAIFIFTPRGKNHGHNLWKMAEKNPKWFSQKLVAGNKGTKREDGSPVVSDQIIQDERDAGMAEELIRQEFFVDFDAPIVGAYYSQQMSDSLAKGRIGKIPFEPKLPVDTYWDIGVGDATTIWFIQSFRGEHRVIDYYEKSGEGLPHFAKLIKGQIDGYSRMADYTYGKHMAPHDIEVREWASGAKSRIETAKEHGVRFRTVPIHRLEDGIEAVRNVLPMCWFDENNCDQGIQALRGYTKEYDEKRKIFRNNPLHNWASHGCLTGDSIVRVNGGDKRIDEVSVGDVVDLGPVKGKVTASEFTGVNLVYDVRLSNGAKLCATGSHKLFTTRGLTRCDALCIGDVLLGEDYLWKQTSLHGTTQLREKLTSSLRGLNFGFGDQGESTQVKKAGSSEWLIGLYGKLETGLLVATRRLSRFFLGKTLAKEIGMSGAEMRGGFHRPSILFRNMMGSASTGDQMDTTSQKQSEGSCTGMYGEANAAQSSMATTSTTLTGTSPITTSVTWSISQLPIIRGFMGKLIRGWDQMRTSSSSERLGSYQRSGTDHQKEEVGTAYTPLKVVSVELLKESQPTYDLTVEGHHCYIANGVLVSNSDAFRCFGMSYKRSQYSENKQPSIAVDNFRYA